MTSLDVGIARLRSAAIRVSDGWLRFNKLFKGFMPKGLYARSLLIIIAPMVILQSVVAFVFMERHWNLVTQNLSAAVVQELSGQSQQALDIVGAFTIPGLAGVQRPEPALLVPKRPKAGAALRRAS